MSERILVVGVGNPLMGDDGIGIEALRLLREGWDFPPEVELVDGGTWGMGLLPAFEDATEILIVDAIEAGRQPGTLIRLSKEELPRHFRLRVSPHHVDLEDVLALLEFRGTAPERMTAIGLEPESVDWGVGLTGSAQVGMAGLTRAVIEHLVGRGLTIASRDPVHA